MVKQRGSPIVLEKVGELDFETEMDGDDEEVDKADNNFELKKWGAEIWSDIPEVTKDFTMANLSDQMFNSRVVNFIRNRVFLVKLLKNVFRYAERKIDTEKFIISDVVKKRVAYETIAFRMCKNLILTDVYTILNLSKGRGGLVLKAFLEGGMSKDEMEVIAGEEGPAIGEPIKRTFMDRLRGKNRAKHPVGKV